MTIESVDSLRAHLQTALELEHSTLPPYLCALYSLDVDRNRQAAEVLQSVVLEEMLHLTLAANLLNAVGGRPVLDSPDLLPTHPTYLPHSNRSVRLSLRPFSREAVEGFLAIERPADGDGPAQDEGYATIGQFYRAIDEAFARLCAELGEEALFRGDPARQVTDALYYGGAGRIVAVTDLASARRALAEIVEQGEGLDHGSIFDGDKDMFHPERDEVGHYFRFQELLLGRGFPLDFSVHLWLSRAALARRLTDAWAIPAFERYHSTTRPLHRADFAVRMDDPAHPALFDE